MFDTSLKKKRLVGFILLGILLALFISFNRIPKLDTVQADLAVAASPTTECFQGFCIEDAPETTLLSRWWDFSLTYLRLVAIGMVFAFLVAGATETFLFPNASAQGFSGTGIRGSLKGLLVGPAMNLCSACIVPVASAFRRRGAGVETTLAITQGSSTLNLPALIMAAMVFAPIIGGARIGLSLTGALLIGPLVAMIVGRDRRTTPDTPVAMELPELDNSTWKQVLVEGIPEWMKASAMHLVRLGPVMVLAGFASGLAIQWISPQTVTEWLGDDVVGIAIAATLGILINVPLLFEIPLVAALLLAGMGTAPAATLLFTAAAGGPITFWGLAKVMPRKAIVSFGAGIWAVGIFGGLGVLAFTSMVSSSAFGLRASYTPVSEEEREPVISTRLVQPSSSNENLDPGSDEIEGVRSKALEQAPLSAVTPIDSGPAISADVTPFTNVALTALKNANEWVDQVLNYRPGVVVFDYDRDGDLDFYITAEAGTPNFLYRNEGDGTFVDVAKPAGVAAVESNSSGAVACDLDNDGYQDLYVGARGLIGDGLDYRSAFEEEGAARRHRDAIKDHLFLNNQDGSFTDLTTPAFGDAVNLRSASSIACADVDGDGWLDIYVGNAIDEDFWIFDQPSHPGHYNVLYHNDGGLSFDEIAEPAGVQGQQIMMRDPQGRILDFKDPDTGQRYEGYDPTVNDGNGNRVADPTGRTHAVLFFDHDDDGDPDLWVANDGHRPYIFRNDSSPGEIRFTPLAQAMGIDKSGNWMGFAVGDYDGDADLDVFVTNVGYHLRLFPAQEEPGGDCRYTDRFPWGTCLHFLLRNDGTRQMTGLGTVGVFRDVATSTEVLRSPIMAPDFLDPKKIHPDWEVPTGLGAYDFGYGATFFDFDNDGRQDLYWLGSEGPPGHSAYPAAGRMLRGNGRGAFEDITVRAHLLDILDVNYSILDPKNPRFDAAAQRISAEFHENGKGLAHGDLNNDGYVDLIGTNSSGPIWSASSGSFIPAEGPVFVWLNGGGENHWITLRLQGRMAIDGTGTNADAIGARVYVKTAASSDRSESLVQVQEVRAGSSYLSMDSTDLEFGLGTASVVDEIIVLWPSGRRQVLEDVSVDQAIVVTEPER